MRWKRPLKPTKIEAGKITICDKQGNESVIDCDDVITSIGYNSKPLCAEGGNVYLVGDAAKVGNLRSAIWGAWHVAMKI